MVGAPGFAAKAGVVEHTARKNIMATINLKKVTVLLFIFLDAFIGTSFMEFACSCGQDAHFLASAGYHN
jgi:hypothetical protein